MRCNLPSHINDKLKLLAVVDNVLSYATHTTFIAYQCDDYAGLRKDVIDAYKHEWITTLEANTALNYIYRCERDAAIEKQQHDMAQNAEQHRYPKLTQAYRVGLEAAFVLMVMYAIGVLMFAI